MKRASERPAEARPIARLRLEKARVPVGMTLERAPVFHVFEELYARTLQDIEARSCSPSVGTR